MHAYIYIYIHTDMCTNKKIKKVLKVGFGIENQLSYKVDADYTGFSL